jgi:hypothetical protein
VSAAPWVAAYAAALIVWLIVLATGRQPTLWKGSALAWLNGAVVAAILAVLLARQRGPGWGLYVLVGLLLVSAIAGWHFWLLLHVGRTEIDQILEKCFTQTRAPYNKTPAGYTVSAGGAEMRVAITPMLAGHAVRFAGGTDSKKAQLICSLIAKQFQPSFPPLRIRT